MKKLKTIFIIIGFIFFILALYYYINNSNHIKTGDENKYSLNVGDDLTIKLEHNPSTGMELSWINSDKSKFVELVDREYETSLKERLGYEGAGGYTYWTYKAKSIGIDTIKIKNLKVGQMPSTSETLNNESIKADITVIIDVK